MNSVLARTALVLSLSVSWLSSDCIAQPAEGAPPAQPASLGAPPRDPVESAGGQEPIQHKGLAALEYEAPAEVNGYSVSPGVRSSVADFYENVYVPAFDVPMGWSGNSGGCVAGSTSQAYIDASFDVINFYRAMVELGPVVNDVSKNASSQEAALMMSVNESLDHDPPPSWLCYTAAGNLAASKSNLALGVAGPLAIELYIEDPGTYNNVVGHRRWILHPPRSSFGIGSVDGTRRDANALWIFASTTSRPATDIVAWPPRGYVPYQLVYPRWSFSLNTAPSADFGSASVSMKENGAPVALNIVSRTRVGYGDNTLVWEPSGLSFSAGQADRAFDIVVSGVGNAGQSTWSYRVTVIDPAMNPELIFSDGFD